MLVNLWNYMSFFYTKKEPNGKIFKGEIPIKENTLLLVVLKNNKE